MARARGACAERLVCHPRLPLVAALDSLRPAVHVWDHSSGQLSELATVGADSAVYGDALGWERWQRTPAVAWHPEQPLLVVAGEEETVRWTPEGCAVLEGLPSAAGYRGLAFSPDGRTLWASPSSGEDDDAWERSDVIDLASGAVRTGPPWDTGVAEHPGGGLVVTLHSNQGATLGLFARVDGGTAPAAMRVLRRALILDVDGYETPVFSADGRHLAIRGNAYDNTLYVFEFPSLHRVLATTFGEPSPGYPYPPEWLAQMHAWSRHNIAFGGRPGVLWIGTPNGTLIELDVDNQQAVEHDLLDGSRVTALAATATGELLVAGGEGDLVLLSVGSAEARPQNGDAVTAFLDSTSEVPEDGDLEEHLVVTDGARAWEPDDLATVDTATEADPTWLQLQSAINNAREQER
nr:WD40 repeat domain-containing protein [Streptomyces cupreus]